jgi:hypothetical protein
MGGLTMKKTFVEIYGLAVCFFSVACFVIVLGIAVWNVTGALYPEFTIDNMRYEMHKSDEAYSRQRAGPARLYNPEGLHTSGYSAAEELSGEALTQARQSSWERTVQGERRSSIQGLAKNSIVLIISILIFWIHWVIATRARESRGD